MIRICFVCLGNICRSPTAEAIMAKLIADRGLDGRIAIDSAGTGAWHVGNLADPRTRDAAKERGISITSRARQVSKDDFERFDLLVAMDTSNRDNLLKLAPNKASQEKIHMLRNFDAASDKNADVPDPYYGGDDGFENVLDICQAGCEGLLSYALSLDTES